MVIDDLMIGTCLHAWFHRGRGHLTDLDKRETERKRYHFGDGRTGVLRKFFSSHKNFDGGEFHLRYEDKGAMSMTRKDESKRYQKFYAIATFFFASFSCVLEFLVHIKGGRELTCQNFATPDLITSRHISFSKSTYSTVQWYPFHHR